MLKGQSYSSFRHSIFGFGLFSSMLIGGLAAAHGQSVPTVNASAFRNPVLWEDLADIDILRVGDAYYYSASNMAYSPGAPVLRSYDLVHWEYIGHSIPVLDFSPAYDMQGGRAYVKGSWASFLGYRKSNKTFYWGGCIEFKKTHIYTATDPAGPWKKHAILDQCYYDAGLLVDDDDTMYVAYGNKKISVAQLSPDGTQQVKAQQVFQTPPEIGTLEGSRFYKINGNYYIFTTRPADGEYVLRSTTGPFGPYEMHKLLRGSTGPIAGGGTPHQGGIVQTPEGKWYYMAFQDAFPGGRVPVLAPLQWDADGWPSLPLEDNHWAASYPLPTSPSTHPIRSLTGTDLFKGSQLGPEWEWNHNPDNSHWSLHNGLQLQSATVTDDLYSARNTLTHRILGPTSTATILVDVSKMQDGDRSGLAMFRDSSAWVGVRRDDGKLRLVMMNNLTMDRRWNTTSTGKEVASVPLTKHKLWLRVAADIHPGPNHAATFSYSLDGKSFQLIGEPFEMTTAWQFFMGYRYGIFNYSTKQLGGSISVKSFTLDQPNTNGL
jgi:beta-xylosidase